MSVAPGDTFILTRATGTTPHLWVVLWGPDGPADAFVIVSLSTLRPHSDLTCILSAGEHPFIQHDTCVVYSDARRLTREKLRRAIQTRGALPRPPMDLAIVERIRRGLLISPRTPHAMVRMAIDVFGADPG